MRSIIAFVLLAAVGIGMVAFGAYGLGAESAKADPKAVVGTYETPDGEITVYGDYSARFEPAPAVWEEDELPLDLTRWLDNHGGGDHKPIGTVEGHRNCWAAIADTTLVMCPDGFSTTS